MSEGEQEEQIMAEAARQNEEVEQFMHRIEFPYTVGYGATECAPIICYSGWKDFITKNQDKVR